MGNDDLTSYPSLNSSMSCSTKVKEGKYVKIIRNFNFLEDVMYYTTFDIKEPITRQWFVFLASCDDENVIFPIMDYNLTLTLSSYVIQRERTCNEEDTSVPSGLMVVIGIVVVMLLVIGGLTMWRCDAHKRKKMRETAAMAEASMNDDVNEENLDEDKNDSIPMGSDDVQLQSA